MRVMRATWLVHTQMRLHTHMSNMHGAHMSNMLGALKCGCTREGSAADAVMWPGEHAAAASVATHAGSAAEAVMWRQANCCQYG